MYRFDANQVSRAIQKMSLYSETVAIRSIPECNSCLQSSNTRNAKQQRGGAVTTGRKDTESCGRERGCRGEKEVSQRGRKRAERLPATSALQARTTNTQPPAAFLDQALVHVTWTNSEILACTVNDLRQNTWDYRTQGHIQPCPPHKSQKIQRLNHQKADLHPPRP